MFRSYEPGRENFVTLIANYNPLQDAYGGPNYFSLDPSARYRIHIDNDGDSVEDLTFEFRFTLYNNDISLDIGGQQVAIPLLAAAPLVVKPGGLAGANQAELYTVRMFRGDTSGNANLSAESMTVAENLRVGGAFFAKPLDNFGAKTFPDYDRYANLYMSEIGIDGCGDGRVFVGQRKESFPVNLGEVFDLVNLNPLQGRNDSASATEDKNITTLALELPISCLTENKGDVIGAWTTAQLPAERRLNPDPSFEQPEFATTNQWVQVSRLGMPLVNEVVIGLRDKNRFNASHPKDDGQFATYVTNPTLPALLELLFGVSAPTNFPRTDLLATFVTGISGLNDLGFGEMLRLNTAIAPTARADQNDLGVVAGDLAGFPNGRRPGDDVVDVALRVSMGLLCHANLGVCDPEDAASGTLAYTDGTLLDATAFGTGFPYLNTPLAGSPNSASGVGGQ
jgi:hypothetical protein